MLDTRTWIDPDAGRVPFAELASRFMATRIDVRPTTRLRDESYLRSLVLPEFGETPIGRITSQAVQGWVTALANDGRAPETVHKAHQLLSMCLGEAVRDRLIAPNPCESTRLPRIEKPRIRILTLDQVDELADAVDPRYRAMVLCGALAGLRIGETAGLTVASFDSDRRSLTIDATLTEIPGQAPRRTPVKTDASHRTVAIPRRLSNELELHLAGHTGGQYLFESPNGGPLRLTNWRRRVWKPAVAASVAGDLRFHELRHTHAAVLIHHGVQPKVIQTRLGHTSITTTMDRYGHLYDGTDQAVAALLDSVLNTIDAPSAHPEDQGLKRQTGSLRRKLSQERRFEPWALLGSNQ